MELLIFLIFVNFTLLVSSLIFIIIDAMKIKKKNNQANKTKGIGKLRGYSFGMGLLSMLMMVFIVFLL